MTSEVSVMDFVTPDGYSGGSHFGSLREPKSMAFDHEGLMLYWVDYEYGVFRKNVTSEGDIEGEIVQEWTGAICMQPWRLCYWGYESGVCESTEPGPQRPWSSERSEDDLCTQTYAQVAPVIALDAPNGKMYWGFQSGIYDLLWAWWEGGGGGGGR